MKVQMKISEWMTVGLITVMMGSAAYAQTSTGIDVDAINQKSSSEINSARKIEKKTSRRDANVAGAILTHIEKGLWIPEKKIENPRLLKGIELAERDLVKCVDKVLDENAGGYDSPLIAQSFLLSAMDNNGWVQDEARIKAAADECNDSLSKLYFYKDRVIDESKFMDAMNALPVNNAAEYKAKNLIKTLINQEVKKCSYTGVKAVGGFLLAVGTGVGQLKCLMSDGRIHLSAGIQGMVGMGFGAAVKMESQEKNISYVIESGPLNFSSFAENTGKDDGGMVLIAVTGVGSLNDDHHEKLSSNQGLAVGAFVGAATSGELSFRLFNGRRHWDMLIDILK